MNHYPHQPAVGICPTCRAVETLAREISAVGPLACIEEVFGDGLECDALTPWVHSQSAARLWRMQQMLRLPETPGETIVSNLIRCDEAAR